MINSNFLNSNGYGWSITELQNLEYSFLTSLPWYFSNNPFLLDNHQSGGLYDGPFVGSTETEFSIAQKNVVRSFLSNARSYEYQVSFEDIINADIGENISNSGDITFLNQDKSTPQLLLLLV
jgi:hypothetical protein